MLGRLEHVEAQLADTLLQLQELASGLHPRALAEHDLAGALGALATQIPVAVEVTVPERRFPAELEAAAYFVCSEGLANVVTGQKIGQCAAV